MAALMKFISIRISCENLSLSSHLFFRKRINEDFVCSTIALTNHVNQPCRNKSNVRPRRRNTSPIWWTKQRAKFFEDNLTKENREFVEEVIENKYNKLAAESSSPLKEPPWPHGEWSAKSRRTGVIAKKIGIYPMWKKDGTRLLTTILQVVDNHVIRYVPPDVYSEENPRIRHFKGKYGCLVVGAESANPQLFTTEYSGLFKEAGVMPKKKLTRFLITADAAIQPGTPLTAMHYRVGDFIDCKAKT